MLTPLLRIARLVLLISAMACGVADAQEPVVVQGTVTSNGQPVAGIEVRLYAGARYDHPLWDRTDSNGVFTIAIPGLPDTTWQTFTVVVADRRIHKGLVDRGVKRDPPRMLGPYNVEAYKGGAASLGQTLDQLEELRRYAGNELAVQAGIEELRTLFPADFVAGSTYAMRVDALERAGAPMQLADLPAPRRDVWAVMMTTPGSRLSVAGSDSRLNTFVVDGASMDDRFLLQTAPLSAASTMAVERDRFNAENAEAGVRIDTKAGTNRLTVSLFEYFRDRSLNGNTTINEDRLRPKGAYRAHHFGASMGGPIFRNRHFFFASYEAQTLTQEQTVFANVPETGAAAADALRRLEPLAANWTLARRQTLAFARTDHTLTAAHRLSFRFNRQALSGFGHRREGTQQSSEAAERTTLAAPQGSAWLTSMFSPTAVNEVRGHYGRIRETGEPVSAAPYAEIRERGTLVLAIGGTAFAPRRMSTARLQVADTFSWLLSPAHDVKAGFEIQDDDNVRTHEPNFAGAYVFDSLAAFGSGRPLAPADTFTQSFAAPGVDLATTTRPGVRSFAAFAQDRWRVTEEMTVNLGLRYQGQRLGLADPRQLNDVAPRIGIVLGRYKDSVVIRGNYGMFYASTPAHVLAAVEAYDGHRVQALTFPGGTGEPVPQYPSRFAGIPTGTSARPVLVVLDPDYRNGRTQEANGSVELEWGGHGLDVQYSHSRGTSLPRPVDTNVGPASPVTLTVAETGERLPHYRAAPGPFPELARRISLQSTADAERRALTINIRGYRSSFVSYRIAYTLAGLTDTAPDSTAVVPESPDDRRFPSNPLDLEADRAAGDADVRHRVLAWASVDSGPLRNLFPERAWPVVDRWVVSAVLRVESGRPYSAYVTTDVNGDRNRFNDIAPGTGRNQFRLPATSTLDMRVTKAIRPSRFDGRGVSVQLDAFNVLNRANYTHVNNTLYAVDALTLRRNPLFGQLTDQADPRIVQLGVRVEF